MSNSITNNNENEAGPAGGSVHQSSDYRLQELLASEEKMQAADPVEVLRLMTMFPIQSSPLVGSFCKSKFWGKFWGKGIRLPDTSLLKAFLRSRTALPQQPFSLEGRFFHGIVDSANIGISAGRSQCVIVRPLRYNSPAAKVIPALKDMLVSNTVIQDLTVDFEFSYLVSSVDIFVHLRQILPPRLTRLTLSDRIDLSYQNPNLLDFLLKDGNRLPKEINLDFLNIIQDTPGLTESWKDNDSVESLNIVTLQMERSGPNHTDNNLFILTDLVSKLSNLAVLDIGTAYFFEDRAIFGEEPVHHPICLDLTDILVCLLQRNKITEISLQLEYTVRAEDGLEDMFKRNTSLVRYHDWSKAPNKTVATIGGYCALLNRHGRDASSVVNKHFMYFEAIQERSWTISGDSMELSVFFGLLLENPAAWALGGEEKEVMKRRKKRKRGKEAV